MPARQITEGVYSVGSVDWGRRLFDGLLPLNPQGVDPLLHRSDIMSLLRHSVCFFYCREGVQALPVRVTAEGSPSGSGETSPYLGCGLTSDFRDQRGERGLVVGQTTRVVQHDHDGKGSGAGEARNGSEGRAAVGRFKLEPLRAGNRVTGRSARGRHA